MIKEQEAIQGLGLAIVRGAVRKIDPTRRRRRRRRWFGDEGTIFHSPIPDLCLDPTQFLTMCYEMQQ